MRHYRVARIARDLCLVLVAVILALTGAGVSLHFGTAANGAPVEKRGIAVSQECVPAGLFGPSSWGWWETCWADVRWKDGTADRVQFDHSRLTSADIDREVDVVQRDTGGRGTHLDHFRADFEPNMVLGSFLSWPLILTGPLIVLIILYRWWALLRTGKLPETSNQ